MGESAVLLRTFSHPSDASREAREGDPICALTESVSFGRFMSESLAWEKWSTFSHNRYLEEVEKFSKPGSVAEKKAYFEAHYKRKAAMKAEVFEEANAAANAKDVSALKTTKEILNNSYTESAKGNCHEAIEVKEQYMANTSTESPMDTESADMMSHVVTEKQWENDSPNSEVAPADADAPSSISMRVDLGDFDVERGGAAIEYAVNVENPTQVDNLKHLQNPDVHDKIEASPVDRMPNKENSALSSKKKQRSSLSRSLPQSGVSRLTSYIAKRTPSLPARNIKNIATNSEESAGDSNEKRRVDPKSLHISINFSPCVSEPSKASLRKPKGSSTPIRTPTRASVNGGPKHLSKLFQSEDKRSKVLVSKSVSGGITEDWQLQSLPMEGSKSSSTTSSKGRPPCISSPFSFRSEERAAKRKEFSQMLEENKNAKEAEKAPMEIRSKEKAEQDIKKLRQSSIFKAKHNESLYCGSHLPINRIKKEKAEHDTGKLQQSTGIKPKPNESLHHGSLSLSKHKKKKALCKPCSPKHGLKPTPTAVHDTSSRPPRRPSVSTESSKHVIEKNERYTTCSISSLPTFGRRPTSNAVQDANTRPPWRSSMNTASFKCVIEKNNRITNRSVTSLPKKNARENASPNIQHSVSKEKGALFT